LVEFKLFTPQKYKKKTIVRNPDFFLFLSRRTANQPCANTQQMKRISLIICFVVAMLVPTHLHAQTPEQVVERMTAELNKGDSLGTTFDLVMSIPILGTFRSTNSVLGDKMRLEVLAKDKRSISWDDGTTNWEYDSEKNEVEITNSKHEDNKESKENTGDMELFQGISEGYNLSFEKKTDDKVWYILCKKSKSNKDKDDPKQMNLAVSKADYSCIYLKAKMKGVTVSMENFKIGVTEEQVTFNAAEFPGVKIVDKR